MDVLCANHKFRSHARCPILNDDVRLTDQIGGDAAVERVVHVERDATLAPVEHRGDLILRAVGAGAIDLDDVRALISEQHPDQWTGQVTAEVDDTNACQRTGFHVSAGHARRPGKRGAQSSSSVPQPLAT